jgi:hypothetical protein
MRGGHERDAGRVSLFLAVAITGVLTVIGLSFDGAGQLRSLQRADNLAAEAARAGGQEIDRAAAIGGGGITVDETAAEATIVSYINDVEGAALIDVTFDTVAGGQDLTVAVSVTYDRYMLGLFGFSDTVTVRGEATALLRTEP